MAMTARSPDWHRDHGSLTPVTLSLKCDAPGCREQTPVVQATHDLDVTARMQLKAIAEENGWYVARDRSSVNEKWDLCPGHAGAAAVRNVGRMR